MAKWDNCPFCEPVYGKYKTELFLRDELLEVVAVRDENAKGFAMRILVIPFEHISAGHAGYVVKRRCLQIALVIAEELWDMRNLYVVNFDWDHHTFKDHYHLQVCLKELR